MREAGHAKDFQSQRSQVASMRQRSHRVSGLALAGCRGNAKMGNRRAADEGSDSRHRRYKAVFKIFCKCAKRGTQRISRARGLRLRACANAATASAAWPWQVAGEMLKWGTDGRPMKVLIPVTVGTISIAFSRRSVKAGVERTLSLRPRMVNRRSACQDT